MRDLVTCPENATPIFSTAFWLKIIGVFIVMGLMAAIVPFSGNDSQTNLIICIIAVGLIFSEL